MAKFKVGDEVRVIKNNIDRCTPNRPEGTTVIISSIYDHHPDTEIYWFTDSRNTSGEWSFNLELAEKITIKTVMSSVTEFVKNLALSKEEKSLRKNGFKNSCGDYTDTAKEFAVNELCKEKESKMIEVSLKMDEEEAAKK